MKETISVVVPTYNAAHSLPRAIESIRAQAWPELEIIVVDDGSRDHTQAVLTSLASDDLHVITEENRGPGAARNRGIEIAHGKWVAFLDADDIWLQGKLQAQMDCLQKDQSLGFCYADSVKRTTDGTEKVHKSRRHSGSIFPDLLFGPQFGTPTIIVRRDCFEQTGLFDPELRTGEDWDLWLRLSASYRGCHLSRAVVRCSVSEDPTKYPLGMLERCQLRVLSNLFSNRQIALRWPQLAKYRRRLYSWHYAVLAKSYLSQRRARDFFRLGSASIRSHPMGLYFLARRWGASGDLPRFIHLQGDSPGHGREN
jgi:glycosyltransferase involved in cell wall biosynthesis